MSVTFSTSSWLVATLVIMATTTIPVKIGADLFGALNKDIKHCALAVVLGTIAAVLLVNIFGGFIGLILAFIAISIIYWQILHISFTWSFVFTIIVLIIQFTVVQMLLKIGVMASS